MSYARVLWLHRGLIWRFHRRDLTARFHGSLLGPAWLILQPMLLFAVYFVVFGLIFSPLGRGEGGLDGGYALYLFAGILVWSSLAGTLSRACHAVVESSNLIRNLGFPGEILPVQYLLTELAIYLAGVAVMLTVGTAAGLLRPGLPLLALPLVLAVQAPLTLGIGLVLAVSQVYFRDTGHAWAVSAVAWMFLSPVFWKPEFVAASGLGPVADLLRLNPAYPLLAAHRFAFGLGGDGAAFWRDLGAVSLWGLLAMSVGYGVFMRYRHELPDLV